MPTSPQSAPAPALATHSLAPTARPSLAETKARAKAGKKARKHESRRFVFSWCACLHALGFSF